MNEFKQLGLDQIWCEQVEKQMILTPTPVQEKAIPLMLAGRDVMAQAKTGTGKTLAFLLPIVQRLKDSNGIQALIVAPTRELVIQVAEELKKLQIEETPSFTAIYGGQDFDKQVKRLARGVSVVVATPGRLLDHVKRETIDLSGVETFVIDEADQMLQFGFLEDVEHLLEEVSSERQMALFSATLSKEIRKLAKRYMTSPETVHIQDRSDLVESIRHVAVEVSDREKLGTLCQAINESRPFLAMVFCRTIAKVSKVTGELKARGYAVDELHGDLSQAKRELVMKRFRSAKLQILVATDVASRGIDVEGVTHVFNYDLPEDHEQYVHRIGRTGRAGAAGMAYTFVAPKDRDAIEMIERGIRQEIERVEIVAPKEWSQPLVEKSVGKGSAKERREEKIEKSRKRNERYRGRKR